MASWWIRRSSEAVSKRRNKTWRWAGLLALAGLPALAVAAVPDISGPWQIEAASSQLTVIDGRVPMLPEAQALSDKHRAQRRAGDTAFDPLGKCLPPGVPRLMMQPYPFNVVQGRTLYGFVFEWNHLNRVVYMNHAHFEPIGPLYLGQSVGHWDHDTLVIDTDSYNDSTLLDDAGMPHSDQLHTVERLRLLADGRLEDRIRIEDPKSFSRPWEARLLFKKRAGLLIAEDYCLGRTGHGELQQQ
jgi:hypothetical protein